MKAKEAKKLLGVTQQTLKNYVRYGKIRFIAINPFHYEYNDEDVYSLIGFSRKTNKINVTYSRVSLNKQKNDLESQTKRLYDYCSSKGFILSKQITDIKSGMNFNSRKGFEELLKDVVSGSIENIIIENKDRLCRFGFDLFQTFCKYHGAKIIVTSEVENKSYEQELTDDLVSIVHYFSMKSYSHRAKLNKIKKELQKEN
jgi:predicted site-specific integrase-resolvase